ncbi:hypothetical protein LCGC14_0462090 [marine sediment metagenome]|uniref:Uncharacterized protein n=1 Tax=marine sediment metagenome TaxID=412755 RepID=A0A0F9SER2_9ZZZZ
MNKENLIWKYFLEQKVFEILLVVGFLLIGYMVVVGVPMAIGFNLGGGYSNSCSGNYLQNIDAKICTNGDAWLEGFIWLMLVGMLGYIISIWFKSNWKEATEKVEKEFKKRKRKK